MEVKKTATLAGHRGAIYALQQGADEFQLYSAGGDGMIVLWDLRTPGEGRLIARVANPVYALHCIRHENLLVVGQNHEGIHLIDTEQMRETATLQLTSSAIFDVQSFENLLLVATGDGTLVVVDRQNLKVVHRVRLSEKNLRTLAVDVGRQTVAVGASDGMIRLLDLHRLAVVKQWQAHDNSVFTLVYDKSYQTLLSGSRDARLKSWDVERDFALKQQVVAHLYAINHIGFSQDGKHFVTCSMDKSIKVWSFDEFKLLKVIDQARHEGHGTSVNKLIWTSFRNQLVSASDDRTIAVWQLFFELNTDH